MRELTRRVTAGGRSTRVVEVGDGPPVVVLHGWGGRIESMAPVVGCLRDVAHVIALDLVGFGEADPPDGAWGRQDHAEHVRAVLSAVGVRRAHFVAHSYGASTALVLAAVNPSLVDKIVAVAASGLRRPPSARASAKRAAARVARNVGRFGSPGRQARDAIYRRIASQDYRDAGDLRPMLVRVVNEDIAHLLPLVASPTLLVWGTDDDAVPVRSARRMERLIPDAGLVLFEGAGHFAYLDEPARFCRVVRHFLIGS